MSSSPIFLRFEAGLQKAFDTVYAFNLVKERSIERGGEEPRLWNIEHLHLKKER
jgi:hypothetical protein